MEMTEKLPTPEVQPRNPQKPEEKFIPKGAIAFFVLMVLLGLVIWYGIYLLMLARV